jgi:anti-sigma regulatory factor (Ser/Thr protein kinase)
MALEAVLVRDASAVAEVRRRAEAAAGRLGFPEEARARAAIVATELATNVVKYAGSGEVLVSAYEDDTGAGLEILALDRGPGMADPGACLDDGYSTGGSAGTGLGAVRRQAQAFDLHSARGQGTAVVARLEPQPERRSGGSHPPLEPRWSGLAVPLAGEAACGDAYCVRPRTEGGWTVVVADGLGHGPQAAEASSAAVRLFRDREGEGAGAILSAVHAGLRHTRGGAVSVARYEADRDTLVFAGLGNVLAAVVTPLGEVRRTLTHSGTAGHVARRIQEFEYPFPPNGLLVMHSDGIASAWSLDPYPGLVAAHPSLIAGVLYRDFGRGRDDATVVVARGGQGSGRGAPPGAGPRGAAP